MKIILDTILKYAEKYKLNPAIVYGVCKKESTMNPAAIRYEPDYRWLFTPEKVRPKFCSIATETALQKCSWGLMQVMGAVYREYGYTDWLTMITGDIDSQIKYGCQHLAKQVKRFGKIESALSAYNAGSIVLVNGKFRNQEYVDDVLNLSKGYTNELVRE